MNGEVGWSSLEIRFKNTKILFVFICFGEAMISMQCLSQ